MPIGLPIKEKYYRKVIISACVIAVILFFIITNIVWLAIDTTPPFYDPVKHVFSTHLLSKNLKNMVTYSQYFQCYPPFVYLTTIPIIKIMGASDDHFVYGNFLYIIILVLSVFGIGKILFDEWTGVSSAFLVLLYPFVFWISRQYHLDFALLAMVSLVQYLILKSEGGTRKYWNIGLGIAIGCALLTKTHGLIFFLPTWIISFLSHWKNKKKKSLIYLLQTLIILLIIALPWYIFAMDRFIEWNLGIYRRSRLFPDNKNLFTGLLFYCRMLNRNIIFSFLFFVFLMGFVSFLLFNRKRKILLFLTAWIIIPCIALALWPNKEPRFILPLLPVFSILTMGGINSWPNKLIKNMVCGFIFFIALIQFTDFSFDLPVHLFVSPRVHVSAPIRPSRLDWKIKETLDFFSSYTGLKQASICVIPYYPYFNGDLFRYYKSLYELPFQIKVNWQVTEEGEGLTEARLIKEELMRCDFVVTAKRRDRHCSGERVCTMEPREETSKKFDTIADELGFSKIREFDLPENYKASIYENIREKVYND